MAPIIVIASLMTLDKAAQAGRLSTFLAWTSAAALPVLIGAAGVLAISIVVETWILRWLDYLERVANAYGRGRYSIRPHKLDKAPAEFRALGKAVGEMAAAVEQRDKELRTALDEKTLLLREVHHRVKNNLQIVGSLLSLQAARADDVKVQAALQDALFRLDAMSLAQRFMQQDEAQRTASIAAMFEAWAGQFRARMGKGPRRLDLRITVEDRVLPLEYASSLVLIANEAVIHAYRRAGPPVMLCEVDVRVGVAESIILQLHIPDQDTAFDGPETMSKDLIRSYVRQLRGSLDISPNSRLTVQAPQVTGLSMH